MFITGQIDSSYCTAWSVTSDRFDSGDRMRRSDRNIPLHAIKRSNTLREGYAVISLRYDWPPKRGTSVGLAVGYSYPPGNAIYRDMQC